ncbi:hypothetical protein NKH95_01225 [Mesorhizobium sp. M0848]|uniref:hypothetical protein n=1 Tax=Mesorhizobium sp. M0848 TaxID=2957012 RepID=UPI00333DBA38
MSWNPRRVLIDLLNQNRPVRAAKALRNALIERNVRGRGVAEGLKFADEVRRTGDRRFCFVIAFNTPWVIDAMARSWELYSSGMTLVVVDNSPKQSARTRIEEICRARGVAYFSLPRNWERHPNRSHGTSMNWIFHNIIRPMQPELFGFLDHDCFPIIPVDIPATMEGKAVYGSKRWSTSDHQAWFLWAGFCFFRFSAMENVDMDFNPRFIHGMDTGGGNWAGLYRLLGENDVVDVPATTAHLNLGEADSGHQMLGSAFLHIGGAGYRKLVNAERYRRLVSNYLWETYLQGDENRLVKEL